MILPTEIILEISEYLDYRGIVALAQTCRNIFYSVENFIIVDNNVLNWSKLHPAITMEAPRRILKMLAVKAPIEYLHRLKTSDVSIQYDIIYHVIKFGDIEHYDAVKAVYKHLAVFAEECALAMCRSKTMYEHLKTYVMETPMRRFDIPKLMLNNVIDEILKTENTIALHFYLRNTRFVYSRIIELFCQRCASSMKLIQSLNQAYVDVLRHIFSDIQLTKDLIQNNPKPLIYLINNNSRSGILSVPILNILNVAGWSGYIIAKLYMQSNTPLLNLLLSSARKLVRHPWCLRGIQEKPLTVDMKMILRYADTESIIILYNSLPPSVMAMFRNIIATSRRKKLRRRLGLFRFQ